MKFSIITATYNSDTTIADNIISVNNQTHKDIEHIFIDNVSSDKTLDIIKNNSNRGTKIHSKKDLGMYYALNQGIDLASGDIIGILNSDDIYYNPKIINEVSSVFLKHNCDIVWGNVIIIKEDSSNIHRIYNARFDPFKSFQYGIMPPHPSVFIKKELYEKYDNFSNSYEIASDYDLVLRFFKKTSIKCKFIDKYLVKMRTGGKSSKSIFSFLKLNYEILKINRFHKVNYSVRNMMIKFLIRILKELKMILKEKNDR